jgi:hypothetical protein
VIAHTIDQELFFKLGPSFPITCTAEQTYVRVIRRTTFGPRDDVVKFNVFGFYRLIADGTNLILAFQDTKLRYAGDRPTDVSQLFCFGKWLSDVENWAIVSKDAARSFVPGAPKGKFFDQRPVGAVAQLPTWLAHCFDTLAPRNLLSPPEDIWVPPPPSIGPITVLRHA